MLTQSLAENIASFSEQPPVLLILSVSVGT